MTINKGADNNKAQPHQHPVVKKLTYDFAMANFDELRDEYNVVEVTEMKTRKTNALLNMTKCVLKDELIKSEMLRNKLIFDSHRKKLHKCAQLQEM